MLSTFYPSEKMNHNSKASVASMFELILVKLKYFLLFFQSIINLLHIFNDKLSQIWGCFWRSKWFQASVFLLWSRICLYALWWIFKSSFSKILNIAFHRHHIKFHHQHHQEKGVMFAYSSSYHLLLHLHYLLYLQHHHEKVVMFAFPFLLKFALAPMRFAVSQQKVTFFW